MALWTVSYIHSNYWLRRDLPDVYPHEFDGSVSDSFSVEISEDNDDERDDAEFLKVVRTQGPSNKKTKANPNCNVKEDISGSDSECFSAEISEYDVDKENDESEDYVKFFKAVQRERFSSTNRAANCKYCDVKRSIPDKLLSLFKKKLSVALPYYICTQVEAILKGLIVFCGRSLISMTDL